MVHFVLQGKGGIGKSVVASWLAEFLMERGPRCDASTATPLTGLSANTRPSRWRDSIWSIKTGFSNAQSTTRSSNDLRPRTPRRARRRESRNRIDKQATHIQRMGRLVSGAAVQAAIPERGQSPAECERAKVSATGFRSSSSLRSHYRSDRGLFEGTAQIRTTDSHEVWTSVAGQDQAGNCTSGIQNLIAYPERRSQAETTRWQSLSGGRVSCLGQKVDSEATLHVGDRAGEDRDRRTQLLAEHRRDYFRSWGCDTRRSSFR